MLSGSRSLERLPRAIKQLSATKSSPKQLSSTITSSLSTCCSHACHSAVLSLSGPLVRAPATRATLRASHMHMQYQSSVEISEFRLVSSSPSSPLPSPSSSLAASNSHLRVAHCVDIPRLHVILSCLPLILLRRRPVLTPMTIATTNGKLQALHRYPSALFRQQGLTTIVFAGNECLDIALLLERHSGGLSFSW